MNLPPVEILLEIIRNTDVATLFNILSINEIKYLVRDYVKVVTSDPNHITHYFRGFEGFTQLDLSQVESISPTDIYLVSLHGMYLVSDKFIETFKKANGGVVVVWENMEDYLSDEEVTASAYQFSKAYKAMENMNFFVGDQSNAIFDFQLSPILNLDRIRFDMNVRKLTLANVEYCDPSFKFNLINLKELILSQSSGECLNMLTNETLERLESLQNYAFSPGVIDLKNLNFKNLRNLGLKFNKLENVQFPSLKNVYLAPMSNNGLAPSITNVDFPELDSFIIKFDEGCALPIVKNWNFPKTQSIVLERPNPDRHNLGYLDHEFISLFKHIKCWTVHKVSEALQFPDISSNIEQLGICSVEGDGFLFENVEMNSLRKLNVMTNFTPVNFPKFRSVPNLTHVTIRITIEPENAAKSIIERCSSLYPNIESLNLSQPPIPSLDINIGLGKLSAFRRLKKLELSYPLAQKLPSMIDISLDELALHFIDFKSNLKLHIPKLNLLKIVHDFSPATAMKSITIQSDSKVQEVSIDGFNIVQFEGSMAFDIKKVTTTPNTDLVECTAPRLPSLEEVAYYSKTGIVNASWDSSVKCIGRITEASYFKDAYLAATIAAT